VPFFITATDKANKTSTPQTTTNNNNNNKMTSGYFFEYDTMVDELQYDEHVLYSNASDLLRVIFKYFKGQEPMDCLLQYDWALEDKIQLISKCTDTDEVATMLSEANFLDCRVISGVVIAVKYTRLLKTGTRLTIDTSVMTDPTPEYIPTPEHIPTTPKYSPTSADYSWDALDDMCYKLTQPNLTPDRKRKAGRVVTRSMTKKMKL
jgi:hypothetical protein